MYRSSAVLTPSIQDFANRRAVESSWILAAKNYDNDRYVNLASTKIGGCSWIHRRRTRSTRHSSSRRELLLVPERLRQHGDLSAARPQ